MAVLINGNGNPAVYAQQDADLYAGFMGDKTVILRVGNEFSYEILSANTLRVSDGVILTKEGRRMIPFAHELYSNYDKTITIKNI